MIPLFSNIGYSEVNSAGNLSDAMGAAKTKLPIQYFKLTGDVTGNLTMPNNASHRKIYLDTNGYNLINPTGSPITNNSSTAITLKGSGDVQSTMTSTSIVNSTTTFQGTNNVADLDNSPLVVGSAYAQISQFMDYQPSFGVGSPNGNSEFRIADGQTGGSNQYGNAWRVRVPSGVNWKINNTVITSGTELNSSQMNDAIGASNSFNKITTFIVVVDIGGDSAQSFPPSGGGYNNSAAWASGFANDSMKYVIRTINYGLLNSSGGLMSVSNHLVYNRTLGRFEAWHKQQQIGGSGDDGNPYYNIGSPSYHFGYVTHNRRGIAPPPQSMNINVLVSGQGRQFDFTNNLTIPIVLSGNDPYNNVTVNAGATATFNRSSTDGSHDILGTITGSSGSNPYALAYVNNGTGTLDVTGYTGINSVSAF